MVHGGRWAVVVAIGVAACQTEMPEAGPDGDAALLANGCWSLEYGAPTAGLAFADGWDLPPRNVRIWTDSTFHDAGGLMHVEAAPGFERPGGGTVVQIRAAADSVELTWTGETSSTHYRFRRSTGSMQGQAWHHSEAEAASDEPRAVRAYPVPCLTDNQARAHRMRALRTQGSAQR